MSGRGSVHAFSSEVQATLTALMRSPALWVWLLAAVVWPVVFVGPLGAAGVAGATPLQIATSLAGVPIVPVLYGIVGTMLTDADPRGTATLERAWWARACGTAAARALLAAASTLVGLAASVWHAEPAFWSPPSHAISSLTASAGFGLEPASETRSAMPHAITFHCVGSVVRMSGMHVGRPQSHLCKLLILPIDGRVSPLYAGRIW